MQIQNKTKQKRKRKQMNFKSLDQHIDSWLNFNGPITILPNIRKVIHHYKRNKLFNHKLQKCLLDVMSWNDTFQHDCPDCSFCKHINVMQIRFSNYVHELNKIHPFVGMISFYNSSSSSPSRIENVLSPAFTYMLSFHSVKYGR